MDKIDQKALVVLSGGQDSVTCLAWALDTFTNVEAITFDYGQRHSVELTCARSACQQMGVNHKVVDMAFIADVSVSALTNTEDDIGGAHALNPSLPASFVPNRNAMFASVAHAWAQTIRAQHVVTGVCQTDFSGYPDCRNDFVLAMNDVLNLGSDANIKVHAPLMYLTKGETFYLAHKLDALEFVLETSHTCYEGDRAVRHDWGYGCGSCPACVLRHNGFEDFKHTAEEKHRAT